MTTPRDGVTAVVPSIREMVDAYIEFLRKEPSQLSRWINLYELIEKAREEGWFKGRDEMNTWWSEQSVKTGNAMYEQGLEDAARVAIEFSKESSYQIEIIASEAIAANIRKLKRGAV